MRASAAGPRDLVLLALAIGLAYASAWPGAFQFDDFRVIVGDPHARDLGAWAAAQPGMRSLLKLSFVANHAAGGLPASYLATNLLIHILASGFAYLLLREWLGPSNDDPARTRAIALAGALLFALHPAQTEAVTYLSGRSVSMMGMLVLSSGWLTLAARDGRDWRNFVAVLLLVMAIAVRESALVAPFLCAVALLARGDAPAMVLRRLRWQFLLVLALVATLALVPGYRRLLSDTFPADAPLELIWHQLGAIAYLILKVVPALEISIDPVNPRYGLHSLAGWLQAGIVVALACLAWLLRRRDPWIAAGIAWLFVSLLPYYSLLVRADWANDRHLYLGLVGVGLVVGRLLARLPARALVVVAILAGSLLVARTASRNLDYRSEIALWSATVAASPGSARAWNNLGYAMELDGNLPEARRHYRQALEIDPRHLQARLNLQRIGAPD